MTRTPEAACHDLLLRLADRLPDELLWRLRDWLAAGGRAALAATLPRELLRNRIGLSDEEMELLGACAGAWGASPRLLDSILPAVGSPDIPTFDPAADTALDAAALAVLAVVRDHPGVTRLQQSWRVGPHGRQRIVTIEGGDTPWGLAATVQRILRAHGDRTPCVEVLPPHEEPSAYHRAAIIGSTTLWGAAAPEQASV
ncbi:hypothetical protein ACQEVB_06250 [Pseudonocardia sp. CA-107938]|uniref:hypothetical protein n=1 Tax=Pseudonocardia sp. CA-107938 TaxID=3240021 RepID=UPI003D8D1210